MILDIVTIALVLVGFAVGAAVLRMKHRQLFAKIQQLNTQIREMKEYIVLPTRDDARVQIRLRKIDRYRRLNKNSNSGTYLDDPFVSQSREDILIYDFFCDAKPGYFIEAGAYNGITFSTTYLLESIGWTGLLVEPIPAEADACRKNRPRSTVVQSALGNQNASGEVEFTAAVDPRGGALLSFLNADEGHVDRCHADECELKKFMVPVTSLDSLLEGKTPQVDFVSLDIEGMELEVLTGFDIEKYKPRLLLIERQSDGGHGHDDAIREYLNQRGYVRSAVKGSNFFFVRPEELGRFDALLYDDERCN